MNGWERIAVVVAILLATPPFLLGFFDDRVYETKDLTSRQQAVLAQDTDTFWLEYRQTSEWQTHTHTCVDGTAEAKVNAFNGVTLTCKRSLYSRMLVGIGYAIWPLLLVWLATLTIRWISAGFRKSD